MGEPEWQPLKPVLVWQEPDGRVNHTGPLDAAFKRSPIVGIALAHAKARARMVERNLLMRLGRW
jgi:hypothetical protein